jgi:hypothetical protein
LRPTHSEQRKSRRCLNRRRKWSFRYNNFSSTSLGE